MGKDRGNYGGEATQTYRDQGGLEQETDKQEIRKRVGSEEDHLGGSPDIGTYDSITEARTREDEALC